MEDEGFILHPLIISKKSALVCEVTVSFYYREWSRVLGQDLHVACVGLWRKDRKIGEDNSMTEE